MAEKIKDAEDRLLESLFESPPVADDGFSIKNVRKVNRPMWLRRFTHPLAAVIGGAIAFKPLTGLVTILSGLSTMIPTDLVSGATSSIPQFQTIVLGAILLGVGLLSMRLLEE
jgi:hypothetical protein